MKTINHSELEALLVSMTSSVIGTICAQTIPQMVKKHRGTKLPNPFIGRVSKQTILNGIIGNFDFESVVTRQRTREADPTETVTEYESSPRSWGNHVPGTGLVVNGDVRYLRICKPRVIHNQLIVDGRPATEEEAKHIKEYLPISKPVERHETEAEIVYRDFKFESLIELRCNGEQYTIDHTSTRTASKAV
jgi:hypothetical protein